MLEVQLSAVPGAVENAPHLLSCHSASPRAKTLLRLGWGGFSSHLIQESLLLHHGDQFPPKLLPPTVILILTLHHKRASYDVPACHGNGGCMPVSHSHPHHHSFSKTLLPSSSQPKTSTPVSADALASAYPSPSPGFELIYILFSIPLFPSLL